MVNINMLKAQMTLNEYTIGKLSLELGVTSKTLSTKLKSPGKFTQSEMEKISKILKIQEPGSIFFASQ